MSEIGTVERPVLGRLLIGAFFGFLLVSEVVWIGVLAYVGWRLVSALV